MAGEQLAKNLDELIAEMIKRARLALQQSDSTPLQRASARTLIERHDDLREKRRAYEASKEIRQQARLDRRRAQADANHYAPPTDWRSRALRSLGLPTAEDREAQAAQAQKQQAKAQEQQARQERTERREARQQAGLAFDQAQENFVAQFPQYAPPKPQPGLKSPLPTKRILAPFIDTPESEPAEPRGPGPR